MFLYVEKHRQRGGERERERENETGVLLREEDEEGYDNGRIRLIDQRVRRITKKKRKRGE